MEILFTVIGILAMLLGLLFVSLSIGLSLRKWLRIKKSLQTTGVVIKNEASLGMRQSNSSFRDTLYKPTVRFQTTDGRTIDYTPVTSNNTSNYSVGENVPVYYNPQQPQEAIIGTTIRLWQGFVVFGLVGGVFALVGMMFVLMTQGGSILNLILR